MRTRCIYCDEKYDYNNSLIDMYLSDDMLCTKCRSELIIKRKRTKLDGLKVTSYYPYEGLIKDLLLQYKECFDEALCDVFFFRIKDEIRLLYHGYTLIPCPSSRSKKERRGFDHMVKMCGCLKMPILDCLYMQDDISQVSKDQRKRKRMIDNIKVKEDIVIPDKILLVDDVITTGSTLLGAYKALGKDKLKAITLCFVNKDAHSDKFQL